MSTKSVVTSAGISKEQLDIIWEIGAAAFSLNNDVLILPALVASMLSKENIEYLMSRYSEHFNLAPTISSVEPNTQALHITPSPAGNLASEPTFQDSSPLYPSCADELPSAVTSPEASADPSLESSDPTNAVDIVSSARLPGKKSRVPRPPNAFILYRQTHHPLLKAAQPLLTNNEISVILGKQWKAEQEDVKDRYRLMADILKNKHAIENPGYQYAPRKPSEKKRRMTVRKALQMQSTKQSNGRDNSVEIADINLGISATSYLASERSAFPSHIQRGTNNEMSLAMPTGHCNVQVNYNNIMGSTHLTNGDVDFYSVRSQNDIVAIQSRPAANAQAFMNSLIDWDGLNDDKELIRTTADRHIGELKALGLASEVLALESELQCLEFQDEFDELLALLE